MFMYHLFKHMVKNITHIFHNLITEAGKSNFNGSQKKRLKEREKEKEKDCYSDQTAHSIQFQF